MRKHLFGLRSAFKELIHSGISSGVIRANSKTLAPPGAAAAGAPAHSSASPKSLPAMRPFNLLP